MKKTICDRCGAEFSPLPEYIQAPKVEYRVTVCWAISVSARILDICPDCQKELAAFFEGGKCGEDEGGEDNGCP